MSLAALQQEYLPLIETGMRDFLDAQSFGSSTLLKEMLAYHLGWMDGSRGKRIRPLITLLCTGALGAPAKNALPAAISIEFLHNFTLIHDDIEDQSPTRHGRPTVWQKWGQAQAINAGDALFSIAQLAMLDLARTCSKDTAAEAANLLNQTCLHLMRGQYLDMAFESAGEIELETYLEMIEGKTAALLAFSAAVAGLIADRKRAINNLSDFGNNLGMAFQIKDDILGIWGNPDLTGKSTASDLHSKKKTLPILYGLKHSTDFRTLWAEDDLSSAQIESMAEILSAGGAKEYAGTLAETYTIRSRQTLTELAHDPAARNDHADALLELSEMLLDREV